MSKTLPTTKRVQLINCKKFAIKALNLSKKAFVIYIAYLKAKISINLTQKAQIALLLAIKVIVPNKYLDFANVFSKKLVAELLECSDINKYAIDLKPGK